MDTIEYEGKQFKEGDKVTYWITYYTEEGDLREVYDDYEIIRQVNELKLKEVYGRGDVYTLDELLHSFTKRILVIDDDLNLTGV